MKPSRTSNFVTNIEISEINRAKLDSMAAASHSAERGNYTHKTICSRSKAPQKLGLARAYGMRIGSI